MIKRVVFKLAIYSDIGHLTVSNRSRNFQNLKFIDSTFKIHLHSMAKEDYFKSRITNLHVAEDSLFPHSSLSQLRQRRNRPLVVVRLFHKMCSTTTPEHRFTDNNSYTIV